MLLEALHVLHLELEWCWRLGLGVGLLLLREGERRVLLGHSECGLLV